MAPQRTQNAWLARVTRVGRLRQCRTRNVSGPFSGGTLTATECSSVAYFFSSSFFRYLSGSAKSFFLQPAQQRKTVRPLTTTFTGLPIDPSG